MAVGIDRRFLDVDTDGREVRFRTLRLVVSGSDGKMLLVTKDSFWNRNPTAHEARLRWDMSLEDAEDLLFLVSLIHRRLDAAVMPLRA